MEWLPELRPALQTRMWTFEFAKCSANSEMLCASARLSGTGGRCMFGWPSDCWSDWPFASDRTPRNTSAPSRAKPSTIALPRPPVAPVTIAFLPFRRLLLWWVCSSEAVFMVNGFHTCAASTNEFRAPKERPLLQQESDFNWEAANT